MDSVKLKNISLETTDGKNLKDINMLFSSGGVYGVVGDNFSGRSEILNIICGLCEDFIGEANVLGYDVKVYKGIVDNLGMSLGIEGFINSYTGFKNLLSLSSIRGVIGKETINDALCLVGLEEDANEKVSTYDFSMKKKLSIAQAIMEKPKIIVIDEPFQYLDMEEREGIIKLLKSINELRKSTIILGARHDNHIIEICKDIYYL
ncbi:MAG: ATP-binding cassette domain-containing protein [Clostridium sp.]